MPHDLYYDFTQSPEHTRRLGARGGRATACNRRQRLATAPLPTTACQAESPPECEPETVAAAITLLDAQFPWLRGAETRRSHQRRSRR